MQTTIADYRLLDTRSGPVPAAPSASVAGELDAARGRALCCSACGTPITDAAARIEVDGQHEHTFFNPAGVVFHVAAFAAAPGCRGLGAFSEEFSWVPGHRWQIGLCAACGVHLGWHFDGPSQFTLLIVDRIRECDAQGG